MEVWAGGHKMYDLADGKKIRQDRQSSNRRQTDRQLNKQTDNLTNKRQVQTDRKLFILGVVLLYSHTNVHH